MQSRRQQSRKAERSAAQITRSRRPARPAIVRPASHVLGIAPASQLSLPSLAGVPTEFKLSNAAEKLAPIAAALVQRGYCTREMWEASQHDLTEFISAGLTNLLHAHGATKIDGYIDLHCGLSDERGYRSSESELHFLLEVGNCGYMQVGKAIDAMEDTAPGLGAAYYGHLTATLWGFCELYDFWRTEQYRDYQIEGIRDEHDFGTDTPTDEQIEKAGYDVVQPRESVPGRILASVEKPRLGRTKKALALLKRHRSAHPEWIEPLLAMVATAAEYDLLRMKDELEESPLPSFVVCFEQHDAICAAFDDYAQTALEGDQATVFRAPFDPANPKAVTTAIEALEMVTDLYSHACTLAAQFKPEDAD
jgi:hypothetical protein